MAARVILAGAVLAGGESRRMGRPKAFIEIDGRAMAVRVAAALADAGAAPVVVVGGDAERLSALGLETVGDRFPGEGPLGGILTALHECSEADAVAVLSCDLKAPSSGQVAHLAAALGRADVAVPVVGSHEQWTHAVWSRGALSSLESAFDAGERAPRRAALRLSVHREPIGALDAAAYADADTPEDLDC